MTTLEKSIEAAIRGLQAEARRHDKGRECPSEELLASYGYRLLPGPKQAALTEHLALCPDCLDAVLAHRSALPHGAAGTEERPVHNEWIERARNLLESEKKEALFDIALRWIQGKIVSLPSALCPLAPMQPAFASLRGSRGEGQPESLRVEKVLDGLSVEVEVSSSGDEGRWNIHVLVMPSDGNDVPEGMRVTLKSLSVKKELQSAPVRKGAAVFRDLSGGKYGLEFRQKGTGIGELSMDLG